MDRDTINKLIDDSPLSTEDKKHWKSLVSILTDDQKKHLNHILSTKIEATKAIELIQKSLDIIAEAESEADVEYEREQKMATPPPLSDSPLAKENNDTNSKEEQKKGITEEKLVQMHTETTQKLKTLRNELKDLSVQAHGTPPPSHM